MILPHLVFDLDGTLIDSAPDLHATGNAVLADYGAAPVSLAEATGFIGEGTRNFVARLAGARGLGPALHEEMYQSFLPRYRTAMGLTRLYPGVPEALAVLLGRGHRMGICTNKPEAPARAVLTHLGLLDFFAAVVGGDGAAGLKPGAGPVRAVLEVLGSGPALYIGDSETDAATARAAGLPLLLYTHGYRKSPLEALAPAAAFEDFADLPRLVGELGQAV